MAKVKFDTIPVGNRKTKPTVIIGYKWVGVIRNKVALSSTMYANKANAKKGLCNFLKAVKEGSYQVPE